jgi:hypothetical protein
MDEITLFTALRPAPPQNQAELVEAARARLAGAAGGRAEQPGRPGRWWQRRPRHRTMLLAACAIAVAAATAIVVPVIVPGGGGAGPLITEAWAIQHNPNGTIRVTFKQARDAAGLQAALRAEGIDAYVRYVPVVSNPSGPVTSYPAEQCGPATIYPIVPGRVVEQVFPFPAGGAPDQGYAVTINPAAIPPGDAIFIEVDWTPGRPDLGIGVQDMVLADHLPPVCTPRRG